MKSATVKIWELRQKGAQELWNWNRKSKENTFPCTYYNDHEKSKERDIINLLEID